jgi:hypothetical protein
LQEVKNNVFTIKTNWIITFKPVIKDFFSKLAITLSYKTYACKYLHLCPTLLAKFNTTQVKNLQYSICMEADVVQRYFVNAI